MSDENQRLENAIDEAGRGAVFARARALGWSTGEAPEYVWWQLVADVKAQTAREGTASQQHAPSNLDPGQTAPRRLYRRSGYFIVDTEPLSKRLFGIDLGF